MNCRTIISSFPYTLSCFNLFDFDFDLGPSASQSSDGGASAAFWILVDSSLHCCLFWAMHLRCSRSSLVVSCNVFSCSLDRLTNIRLSLDYPLSLELSVKRCQPFRFPLIFSSLPQLLQNCTNYAFYSHVVLFVLTVDSRKPQDMTHRHSNFRQKV